MPGMSGLNFGQIGSEENGVEIERSKKAGSSGQEQTGRTSQRHSRKCNEGIATNQAKGNRSLV